MTTGQRYLLAGGILLVDLVIFFLPLTALFLIYIVLVNPPWFRQFLESLDRSRQAEQPREENRNQKEEGH